MLDEMTAALPANLTERVLEVVGRQRGGDRCVIFISHRMIEIAAVCDRATVLREGVTVGVVDVTAGLRGADRRADARRGGRGDWRADRGPPARPRPGRRRAADRGPRPRRAARSSQDVSFELYPGEVLGVVALEGQGQDELFDILAGSDRPERRRARSSRAPVTFRHPADAIRAGVVYVPADRAEALLMQRSVSENIALPFIDRGSALGPDPHRARRGARSRARSSGCRSTPAPRARSGGCRAATSRRSRSPAGWRAACGRCCASTPPAASTSGRSTRSTSCSATSPRRAPRSCSTRPSSRRSSSPATGRS